MDEIVFKGGRPLKNLLSGGVICILITLLLLNYLSSYEKETIQEQTNTSDIVLSNRAVQNFELPNLLGEKKHYTII